VVFILKILTIALFRPGGKKMNRRIYVQYGQCGNCEHLSRCGSDLILTDCQFYQEIKNEDLHHEEEEFEYYIRDP
jgi:hypothetical protein